MLSIETFAVRGVDDAALMASAREHAVALSLTELREISERLGRDPSMVEIYAFNAQWSEHCSYKSSRRWLRELPTTGPNVILGPGEDAGIVALGEWKGERYGIVAAHESHNHPSQVVPFEGAATGIGGIVRDVLCMGATLIGLADPLRLGCADNDEKPHARYVARSVVGGIAAYGNAIGVPNMGGDVYFDAGFDENCLVNVVALGLVKEKDIIHSAAPPEAAGWDIVLVGKATDASGFGGAAFSSLVLDAQEAEANKGAVQVPDPFLKNVIMRASYHVFETLRRDGVLAACKDLGAGGLLGCSAEMVAAGGFGATIDLEKVPIALAGLAPAIRAVGETQERLCWVVPPAFTPRLLAIYNDEFGLPDVARGACAAVVGRVEPGNEYVLQWQGSEIARIPLDFLTASRHVERASAPSAPVPRADSAREVDVAALLPQVLAHRDVSSRLPLFERYDAVVRGTTVIPAGYGDAGIVAPIPGAPLGVALSVDGNPRYGKVDARCAAMHAVCEAARNVAASGARPAALTDCLNFGNPENPAHFRAFRDAVDGLAAAAKGLGLAFISGNVSLYNESKTGSAVPPSPIVACIGTVADISKVATFAFKEVGSPIYVLGARQNALGGSVLAEIDGMGSMLPALALAEVAREIEALLAAFDRNLVLAAHDISDGGLLTALAEMAIGVERPQRRGPIGVQVTAAQEWAPDCGSAGAWFGEAGGFVIEVERGHEELFAKVMNGHGVPSHRIGMTTERGKPLAIEGGPSFDLALLERAWRAPLRAVFGA